MNLIEIETSQPDFEQRLVVNGMPIRHSHVWESGPTDRRVRFYGNFPGASLEPLNDVPLAELLAKVQSLVLIDVQQSRLDHEGWSHGRLNIELGRPHAENGRNCRSSITFEMGFLGRSYSVVTLVSKMRELVSGMTTDVSFWPSKIEPAELIKGFGIESNIPSTRTIGEIVSEQCADLLELLVSAEQTILENSDGLVVKLFKFPAPIKTACEQYLLYFGQFLKDLGISADTQVREEESRVLFTVIPVNKEEALDRIREALNCYLQMPTSPDGVFVSASNSDVSVMQLQSNIYFLKSQITLAKALIQAKDATISAQQTEIGFLQSQNLDLRRFLPAESKFTTEDSEPLVNGLIDVKKYQYKGVEFNLPEILRRLKRKVD